MNSIKSTLLVILQEGGRLVVVLVVLVGRRERERDSSHTHSRREMRPESQAIKTRSLGEPGERVSLVCLVCLVSLGVIRCVCH